MLPRSARIHALRALAEIKDHRSIPVMMKVMEEDFALLQHWERRLGSTGTRYGIHETRMNKMNFFKNIKFGRPSVMQIIVIAVRIFWRWVGISLCAA